MPLAAGASTASSRDSSSLAHPLSWLCPDGSVAQKRAGATMAGAAEASGGTAAEAGGTTAEAAATAHTPINIEVKM